MALQLKYIYVSMVLFVSTRSEDNHALTVSDSITNQSQWNRNDISSTLQTFNDIQTTDELSSESRKLLNSEMDMPEVRTSTHYPFDSQQNDLTSVTSDIQSTDDFATSVTDSPTEALVSEMLLKYSIDVELGNLSRKIKEHCPEWIPCTENWYTVVNRQTCCLECKCETGCHVTHSCCPGYLDTSEAPENGFDVTTTCKSIIRFANLEENLKILKLAEYLIVETCPANFTNKKQNNDCLLHQDETLSGAVVDFRDILPVTDTMSYSNYANRHCASCHGVLPTDMIFWNAQFRCSNPMPFDLDTVEQDIQTRNDCLVVMVPPSDDIVNATFCFSDVISECNVTGNWTNYDHQIHEFCGEVDWLYMLSDGFETDTRYKNIFCAICNGDDYTLSTNFPCPNKRMNFDYVNFVSLVNYNAIIKNDLDEDQTEDVCHRVLIFDPVQQTCRLPACSIPLLYTMDTMTCEEIYQTASKGINQFSLVIHPSPPLTLSTAREFHVAVTKLFDETLYYTSYYFATLFFKTNIKYADIDFREIVDDLVIENVIIVVYNERHLEKNPFDLHLAFKSDILQINETIMGFQISLELLETDLFFLPDVGESTAIKEVIYHDDVGGDYMVFSVYHDPYEGVAMITNEVYSIGWEEFLFQRHHFLFDKTFLSCPTFLYELSVYDFIRFRNGLKLTGSDAEFGFEDFRSRNNTHVSICVSAIQGIRVNNGCPSGMVMYDLVSYLLVLFWSYRLELCN